MHKRRWAIVGLLAAIALGIVGFTVAKDDARSDMEERVFEFQLGKTLEETAKKTTLPLSGQNNWGMVNAGVIGLADGVYGRYVEPGYELKLGPLAGIEFYADTNRYPSKKVETVQVTLRLDHITTLQQAYDYAYGLISQFQNSKWKRYIPEVCPRLQGKSSILDQAQIEALSQPDLRNFIGLGCPIDPTYKPNFEDWKKFAGSDQGASYLWHDGAGKVAKLDLTLSETDPAKFKSRNFRIDLEFELQEVMLDNEKGRLEADLKQPWGERIAKVEIEKRRIRDLLEAMALKREEQLAER